MLSAAELHERGRQHMRRSRHNAALRDLERALERSPDADRQSLVLTTMSLVEFHLSGPDQAFDRIQEALAVPDIRADTAGVAKAQLALLIYLTGDYSTAITIFDRALPALPEDSVERANTLQDYGNALALAGDLEASARAIEESLRIYGTHGDERAMGNALTNLGRTRMDSGDLVAAMSLFERASTYSDGTNPADRAYLAWERASVLIAAGRSQDAVPLLHEAAQTFGRHRHTTLRSDVELELAATLVETDPASAASIARAAARRYRRSDLEKLALCADAIALAATAESAGASWLARGDNVATQLRDHGAVREARILDLQAASVAVRRREFDTARRNLLRGRRHEHIPTDERLQECHVRAEIALAFDRPREALRELSEGLDRLHVWQASFGSLDLMGSVAGQGHRLARLGTAIALDSNDPSVVFEWSERARSLAARIVPVRPPEDPQLATELAEIRRIAADDEDDPTSRARLEELQQSVTQRAWRAEGSGRVHKVVQLQDMQAALGGDTALLCYVRDGGRLVALVVVDDRAEVVPLGASATFRSLSQGLQADLDMSAARLSPAMSKAVQRSTRDRLDRIGELLLTPVLPDLGDRRVVITQPGLLSGVPWGMLDGFAGRPHTIATTASAWLADRGPFEMARPGFVAGPHVPRALEEVRDAASNWEQSTVLGGADASVDATLGLAAAVDILHVSAHGHHSAENPLFSGLLLGDGHLYGYDIDRLSSVPDIVILSACEVGRSTQRWAEESLGMVNAWLHAGVRCVVASPAAVSDDRACEVLRNVHAQMAKGVAVADALADVTASDPTTFSCFGSAW